MLKYLVCRRFYFFALTIVLFAFSSKGQVSSQLRIDLPWSGDFIVGSVYGQEVQLPSLPFEFDQNGLPVYIYKEYEKGISKFKVELTLIDAEYANPSNFDKTFIAENGVQLANDFSYEYRIAKDRNREYLAIEIQPYIYKNGELKRVKSASFTISRLPGISSTAPLKFVTNSAMSSGQWYKIAVPTNGVYKIDQTLLKSLGINTSGLNPNHIHVFGNAMGMLPENNGISRPDDLVNNYITIVGDGDGSFDAGDYILFYANGPDEIRFTGGRYTQIKNIYNTQAYYYVCIDASKSPRRMGSAELSNQAASHSVQGSDQVVSYERDERKYINDKNQTIPSGKRWFGELFDIVLQHSFNFNLTGMQTSSPIEIQTSFGKSGAGGGSFLRLFINNGAVSSHDIPMDLGGFYTSSLSNHNLGTSNLALSLRLDRVNPSLRVFLDKIEINYRRNLQYSGGQYFLRDRHSIGQISDVNLTGASNALRIWEITNATETKNVSFTLSNNQASFRFSSESLRQFVAFTDAAALVPVAIGKVQNQNLHALPRADYLIVTHADFMSQANRLADLHREDGWVVHVVDVDHVYNEFSSGMQDPVAIRWFAKMFYDRANIAGTKPPLNLALFGDGSYDPLPGRNPGNNNKIVTYQTDNSEDYTFSITSDGFFVLLDDTESFNAADGMDMGVGRLIATTPAHAKLLVDKVEHYKKYGSGLFSNQTLACQSTDEANRGDWQLVVTHIADDEDSGQFVVDHENYIGHYAPLIPAFNSEKIYLDAYPMVATSGGKRFPSVPPLIDSRVQRGNLIMNYVGHGGETGLAAERVVTIPQIESWTNIDKLMLFVSATCEFTRFDDFGRESAGELMYLSPKGGAFSMMTTTRAVYISVNSVVGAKFYENVFNRDEQRRPITLGEVIQNTLNQSSSSGGDVNRRAFMLLGDPMLRLSLPSIEYKIVVDSINGLSPALVQDTMKSLGRVRVIGHIEDNNGNVLNNVNGFVVPTIFDKPKMNRTLGQHPNSPEMNFETQRNIIFRGKSSVTGGMFNFEFVVPKDIDYSFGNGKMSLFFYNNNTDGAAAESRFKVGGVDPNGLVDRDGPQVELYLNSPSFVNGGMTNENPIFFAKLFDENGINAVGNGIGHDITLILNNNSGQPIVLNDYYQADLDTYKSGIVRFQMPRLESGRHTLTFKVWDVNNNSSDATIDFIVVKGDDISLNNVLNYPNPFTTYTEFFFEHNQPGLDLEAQIQIFTISGKLVKTINQSMANCGFRTQGIPWDGRDEFGDQLARGTYIYRVSITTPSGEKAEKFEKLVLLR